MRHLKQSCLAFQGLKLFPLPGHVINRQKDHRLSWPGFKTPGIEQHGPRPQVGKIVPHFKIIHAGVLVRDLLQQLPQLWNIPLPITEFVHQTPFRLLL